MTTKDMSGLKIAGFIAFIVLEILLAPICAGYVVATLWHWFAVPFGVKDIGVLTAIGLTLLVSAFSGPKKQPAESKELGEAVLDIVCTQIGTWGGLLLFGWIIHKLGG